METPQELRTDRHDALVRTHDYDDGTVIAVDFGGRTGDLAVDLVGETVIVVADDEQVEFELPEGASGVSVNNGTVTIEE